MKHFLTLLLLLIAPSFITANGNIHSFTANPPFKIVAQDKAVQTKPISWHDNRFCVGLSAAALSASFSIKADDKIFTLTSDASNPCIADVSLEAYVMGQTICPSSSTLFVHAAIDLENDGIIDMVASSDVDHHFQTWTLDTQDNVIKLYLAPQNLGNFAIILPTFKQERIASVGKVYWTVSDLCGYEASFSSTMQFIDKKAPTPFCVSVTTAIVEGNPSQIEFFARDFDKGAFDNCTQSSDLRFTFDDVGPIRNMIDQVHYYTNNPNGPILATLDDFLMGKAYKWYPRANSSSQIWIGDFVGDINIHVWDTDWNSDFCTVVIKIASISPETFSIGKVTNVKDIGIENAFVTVNMIPHYHEFPKTVITDSKGYYRMKVPNLNYEVWANYYHDSPANVTLTDWNILNDHLSGVKPFQHYWQFIAADINEDRVVDWADLAELREIALKLNKANWKVIVKNNDLTPSNWTEYTEIYNSQLSYVSADFVAILKGDLDDDTVERHNKHGLLFATNHRTLSFIEQNEFISINPNPMTSAADLMYIVDLAQSVEIKIVDVNGTICQHTLAFAEKGTNIFSLNDAIIPKAGVYIVTIEGEFGRLSRKFIKIN